MIYMVWQPADRADDLSWFEVFATKKEAMMAARELSEKEEDPEWPCMGGWDIKYIPFKSKESYLDYQGRETIVVEQRVSYYHGA